MLAPLADDEALMHTQLVQGNAAAEQGARHKALWEDVPSVVPPCLCPAEGEGSQVGAGLGG